MRKASNVPKEFATSSVARARLISSVMKVKPSPVSLAPPHAPSLTAALRKTAVIGPQKAEPHDLFQLSTLPGWN